MVQEGIGKAASGEKQLINKTIGRDHPCNRRGGAMNGGVKRRVQNLETIFGIIEKDVAGKGQQNERRIVEAQQRD
jgi:hypothetical protein